MKNVSWWLGLVLLGVGVNLVLVGQHLAGAQWGLALANGLNVVLLAVAAVRAWGGPARQAREARALQQSKEQFRLSEARFQRLAHSNLIGIITADGEGTIREATTHS